MDHLLLTKSTKTSTPIMPSEAIEPPISPVHDSFTLPESLEPIGPTDTTLAPEPTSSLPTSHPMVTRLQKGVVKPNPKYFLATLDVPTEPKSVKSAMKHDGWLAAMHEEIQALHQNGTWELVPRLPDMNIIGSKWVFKTKLKSDGSLERLKARLVAKGFNQVASVDFHEIFSPVIKPTTITIRVVLSIALSQNWDIRQLDVKKRLLPWAPYRPDFYGTTTWL